MSRILFTIIISTLLFSGLILNASPTFAISDDPLANLNTIASGAGTKKGNTSVAQLTGQVLGVALSLVGVLFFILMVYGGILWMTASGNQEQTSKALKTLVYAIIGLIIVLGSYVIVNFVFESVAEDTGERGLCSELPLFQDACGRHTLSDDCLLEGPSGGGASDCNWDENRATKCLWNNFPGGCANLQESECRTEIRHCVWRP